MGYALFGPQDPAGGIATTAYDKASNVIASVDELGNRTSYVYDGLNRVVAVQDALGNFATTVYDKASNVLAMVDPLGHRTSYSYDALHRQVTATDALGNVVTTAYDAASNVIAVTGPRGFTTSFAYDALHRRVQTENALGDLSTVVYDKVDNAVAFVDELGRRTTSTYDALDRLESRTDALNHTTTYVYDAAGNPTRMIDPLSSATSYAYDALNRRVSVQDPGGGIATTVYDPTSNVVNTIDPVGNKTTYVYDALNRRVETRDAEGGVTTVHYDAASNVQAVVDPVGNRTTFAYDALHREVERIDPLGNAVTMAYDAAGRMTSRTDRLGRRRDFGYDDANRLTGETWLNAAGGTDQLQTYTYDAASNRLTAQDPDGSYTFSYDALNRVATQQGPFGLSRTFSYDAVSNRTKVEDSKGGVTTSTYNAVNLLLRRDFGGSGQTPLRFDQTYTARDQLESVTRYSDLAGMNKVGATSYAYDAAGRTTNIHHRDGSGVSLLNLTYTYDLASRVTSETEDGATKTYTYDATDQLTGDGSSAYTYDPAGNRTLAGYQTGAGNRLTNDGTYTYTHDAEGNRTKKSKGVNDETWTYGYDHRNQLTWIEKRATDGGTLELRLEFKYDSFNRRIEESRWTSTTGTVVTRFGFDGINPWAELDGSNALTMRRLFGDGVDELVARVSGAGVAGWYGTDRLGSVRLNVSGAGGVLNRNTFGGFGQLLGQTNPSAADAYNYTGKAYQGDSGIQWNLHRWYDTRTGRWLTEDPWHFGAGDYNLYRYVENSPTNATDPTGLLLFAYSKSAAEAMQQWLAGEDGVLKQEWRTTPKVQTTIFPAGKRWVIYPTDRQQAAAELAAWSKKEQNRYSRHVVWALKALGSDTDHAEVYWRKNDGAGPFYFESGRYSFEMERTSVSHPEGLAINKKLGRKVFEENPLVFSGAARWEDLNLNRLTLAQVDALVAGGLAERAGKAVVLRVPDLKIKIVFVPGYSDGPPMRVYNRGEYYKVSLPRHDHYKAMAVVNVANADFSSQTLGDLAINDAEKLRTLRTLNIGLTFALHLTPGGATAAYFALGDGEKEDAIISGIADVASLGLAAPYKAVKIACLAIESGVIAWRGSQLVKAAGGKDWERVAGLSGEIVLRMLMVGKLAKQLRVEFKTTKVEKLSSEELAALESMKPDAPHARRLGGAGQSVAPKGLANSNAPRPNIKANLPDAVTKELPPGMERTGKLLEQTRNFASRNIQEARAWWEARTGERWPLHADPAKRARGELQWAEHPRALAKGGDPLFIEPGKGLSKVEPHVKSGESSEFGRRPPAPGNRPRGRPPKGTPPKPTRPPGRPPKNPPAPPSQPSLFPDPPEP